MKEKPNLITQSMQYENFLKKGFQFDKRIKKASNREFLNLVNSENGENLKWLGSFDKQLIEIKERLTKTTELLINQENNETKVNSLKNLLIEIYNANSSENIFIIATTGLNIIKD